MALGIPALLLVIPFLAGPLAAMVWRGVAPEGTLSASALSEVLRDEFTWQRLAFTTAQALLSTVLAVPAETGLGSGVAGRVVRSRAQVPTWLVDLALGGRLVEARWEWDLMPPAAGTRLAIAARPGTLRVFSAGLEELPSPASPSDAAAPPASPASGQAAGAPTSREQQRHREMPLH